MTEPQVARVPAEGGTEPTHRGVGVAGIQSVVLRIGQIEATLGVRAPRAATVATSSAPMATPSFADVLAAATGNAGSSAPGVLRSETYPPDLTACGNGRIPAAALQPVGSTGHLLWAPAAASLDSMISTASRDGVRIGITDSYRSYDAQVDVARRKGLYAEGGLAAVPGTSDHGWGRSVDLNLDHTPQTWMRTNAGRFGHVEDVPREPWHWTYSTRP